MASTVGVRIGLIREGEAALRVAIAQIGVDHTWSQPSQRPGVAAVQGQLAHRRLINRHAQFWSSRIDELGVSGHTHGFTGRAQFQMNVLRGSLVGVDDDARLPVLGEPRNGDRQQIVTGLHWSNHVTSNAIRFLGLLIVCAQVRESDCRANNGRTCGIGNLPRQTAARALCKGNLAKANEGYD